MKRIEAALFVHGKPTRGILEQFEATDQTFITSGNADGVTDTLNFTNSTGGTFTVTDSALLFNDAYVTGGVFDPDTGTITFTNSEGGTFTVTGFQIGDITAVTGGVGITVTNSTGPSPSVAVDSTVVRTSGTQTIAGLKTFSDTVTTGEYLDVVGEDPRVRLYADAGDHPGLELYDGTTRKWTLYNDPNDSHNLNIKDDGNDRVSITQTGKVGIGITDPATTLDVHHDPTNLADDTGGGEVVTFGTSTGALVKGKLYYLNTLGVWTLTRANASSSNGNSQLLGIALGTAVDNGILLRGFFDMRTYLTGTFADGISLYVCETTAGNINIATPAAANEFIRVVGYATSTENVIYFSPDGTYITLS